MTKYPMIEAAKVQARMCFIGMAIPTKVENIDGEMVQVEKILKFNRKALRRLGKVKASKANPRLVGGEDTMIVPVGQPGSQERIEELAKQYGAVSHLEISPFAWKGE